MAAVSNRGRMLNWAVSDRFALLTDRAICPLGELSDRAASVPLVLKPTMVSRALG